MYKLRIIELELGTRSVTTLWLSFASKTAALYGASMVKPGSVVDLYLDGKFVQHLGVAGI